MSQIRAAQAKDGMAPVMAPAAPSLLPQPVVAAAGTALAPVSSMGVSLCLVWIVRRLVLCECVCVNMCVLVVVFVWMWVCACVRARVRVRA
jgi:hypothetical protein